MNYSEQTDDQINLLVFKARGWTVGHVSGRGNQFCEHKDGGWTPKVYDYCNDWAAIGNLIHDNQIETNITQCAAGSGPAWWCHRSKTGDDCDSGYQPTPMRAAAITFLMMQGES